MSEVTVKGVIRGTLRLHRDDSGAGQQDLHRAQRRPLLDGAVKTITQDGVVFSQDVNDPLSLVKQREVPKRVRATEGRG